MTCDFKHGLNLNQLKYMKYLYKKWLLIFLYENAISSTW